MLRRLTLALALALTACASSKADLREARVYVPKATGPATPRLGCSSGGCAYVPTPEAKDLPLAEIDDLIRQVNQSPVGSDSLALDTLLFHDGEVRERLADPAAPRLSPPWEAFLHRELDRQTATFTLRVIDENGNVRALLPETRMALGAKKHMEITQTDLGTPMNANGTLVRVGLNHVWYRM